MRTLPGFTLPSTSETLTVPVTSFTATDNIAVTGYKITGSSVIPDAGDAGWSTTAPTSYAFTTEGTKTLYAWVKDAAGNISVSVSIQVAIVLSLSEANTLGNTNVFSSTTTAANRRALPVTFSEPGKIQSISIYHNGGTGNVLLGVYSDKDGLPSTQLGVTASTEISKTSGWQTVTLSSPVSVTSGQAVWLAWVFEKSPGVRYSYGTPGRAQSGETWSGGMPDEFGTWSGGMPDEFGTSTVSGIKFSVYCTYISGVTVAPYLDVTPAAISLENANVATGTFDVVSNTTWSISVDEAWLDVSSLSGSNNETVTITAEANTGTTPRSATITVSGTGVPDKTVTVTQNGIMLATTGNTDVFSGTTTAG